MRADVVLLGPEQPTVLLPGPLYEPAGTPFEPPAPAPLSDLVDRALVTAQEPVADAPARPAEGEATTPTDVVTAIRGAAESHSFTGTRWVVAGVAWALAFALVVPLAAKGLVSSVDMTVDLWGDPPATAEAATTPTGSLTPAARARQPAWPRPRLAWISRVAVDRLSV